MAQELYVPEWPSLRNPVLMVGLGGWTNAGETATGGVSYLREKLRARKFGWLAPDEFYQYTVSRPKVAVDEGRIRALSFPSSEFYYWSNPDEPRDLVLLVGGEPDLRWQRYIELVLGVAQQVGATLLCAVGSYYDSVPHTRDVLCRGSATDAGLVRRMQELGVEPSGYVGPTGILTALIKGAEEKGLSAFSLLGRSPHYVQIQNPAVWHAVLWRTLATCHLRIDITALLKRGEEVRERIDATLKDNAELREHVASLEAAYDASQPADPLQQEDILRSVEEFLREQGGPDEPQR